MSDKLSKQLQKKFIILSVNDNTCQTVTQTILIHNIILQIDIHCQTVSNKLSKQLHNNIDT